MSSQTDLKSLWRQQPVTPAPPAQEIMKKGTRLSRWAKRDAFLGNLAILLSMLTLITTLVKSWGSPLSMPLTIMLVIVPAWSWFKTSTRFFVSFFNTDIASSSLDYVRRTIACRRKLYVFQNVFITLYYSLLSVTILMGIISTAGSLGRLQSILAFIAWLLATGCFLFFIRPIILRRLQSNKDTILEEYQATLDQLEKNPE